MHLHVSGLMSFILLFMSNCLPSPMLDNIYLFEILFGSYLTKKINVFGSHASHKLSPRSTPCIFLGYSSIYKSFWCFDPNTSRIYVTRHAQFDEFDFPFANNSPNLSNASNLDFSKFFESQVFYTQNGQSSDSGSNSSNEQSGSISSSWVNGLSFPSPPRLPIFSH